MPMGKSQWASTDAHGQKPMGRQKVHMPMGLYRCPWAKANGPAENSYAHGPVQMPMGKSQWAGRKFICPWASTDAHGQKSMGQYECPWAKANGPTESTYAHGLVQIPMGKSHGLVSDAHGQKRNGPAESTDAHGHNSDANGPVQMPMGISQWASRYAHGQKPKANGPAQMPMACPWASANAHWHAHGQLYFGASLWLGV